MNLYYDKLQENFYTNPHLFWARSCQTLSELLSVRVLSQMMCEQTQHLQLGTSCSAPSKPWSCCTQGVCPCTHKHKSSLQEHILLQTAGRVECKSWWWWSKCEYNDDNTRWWCGLFALCLGPQLTSAPLSIWRPRPANVELQMWLQLSLLRGSHTWFISCCYNTLHVSTPTYAQKHMHTYSYVLLSISTHCAEKAQTVTHTHIRYNTPSWRHTHASTHK